MDNKNKFSNVTKSYLCRFYEILEEMIVGMTDAELTNSISHNFIAQMVPHHKAAIEMSNNILQYTTLVPLQDIALNIISEQTKSIESMQNALNKCSELKNSPEDQCLYQKNFEKIIRTMFTHMHNACSTNDINQNFIREMIPHHKGAIHMSKNLLCFDICHELDPIADAIIKSQCEGVHQMEQLLHCIEK